MPKKVTTVTGPPKSTEYDGVVTVAVGTRGPYGLVLDADATGRCAVIQRWEKLGDGKSGPVERHGGVRLGDVLIGVNETPTADLEFPQVLALLKDENSLRKNLHFCSMSELERRRGASSSQAATDGSSSKRFTSRVRRARVAEPSSSRNHRATSNFAEYEVVCALRVDASKVEHDAVRKWAVWRRYSDFEKTDLALRQSLGWRMNDVGPFPPKHRFVVDKLRPDFVEKRREELDHWWQKVIAIDRVTDLHMHHCEPSLKAFVDADAHLLGDAAGRRPQNLNNNTRQNDNVDQDLKEEESDQNHTTQQRKAPAAAAAKRQPKGRPVSLKSRRRGLEGANSNGATAARKVTTPPPAASVPKAEEESAVDNAPPPAPPKEPKREQPPQKQQQLPPPTKKPPTSSKLPPGSSDPGRNALLAAIRAA